MMILKWMKTGVIAAAGVALCGGLLFGTDLPSYVMSSARSVQSAVKDSVPIDFELRRARDLLTEIIPEMQANIRLIAQEEVEVAELKADIEQSQQRVTDQRGRIRRVRGMLTVQRVSYRVGGQQHTREELTEQLSWQFDRFQEAEVILAGKRRLLVTREKSLAAAMKMLNSTRGRKVHLEDQIASLDSQFRLVKAASVGSRIQVDNSKLAQTEKLIRQIKKRLDVAERVLAHEAQFVQQIDPEPICEQDVLAQVDEYFAPADGMVATDTDESGQLARANGQD